MNAVLENLRWLLPYAAGIGGLISVFALGQLLVWLRGEGRLRAAVEEGGAALTVKLALMAICFLLAAVIVGMWMVSPASSAALKMGAGLVLAVAIAAIVAAGGFALCPEALAKAVCELEVGREKTYLGYLCVLAIIAAAGGLVMAFAGALKYLFYGP